MPRVPHFLSDVSPALKAGLLLAALTLLRALRLPCPDVDQVLEATGAGRSRAYELRERILEALPGLARPPGRPQADPPPVRDTGEPSREVLRFLMEHPGCARHGGKRRRYVEAFRRFVIELRERHPDLDPAAFADAVGVPLGTLKDWLRGGRSGVDDGDGDDETVPGSADGERAEAADGERAAGARLETILDEWNRWTGGFVPFCDHIGKNLRIPYGRTLLANILEKLGVRIPRRRSGRSPDEMALRGSFETFFPGAQWEGDGSPIDVEIDGRTFAFNLEAMVDAHTDAFCGISVRDHEDGAAVVEAFEDGVGTTGAPPLALSLDGRPSNHTDEVVEAIGDTLVVRGTPGRPQNRPHVEGGFGLFVQTVPPLAIRTGTSRETARRTLELVARTWARTINNKTRRVHRDGCSRARRYERETPSQDEIAAARTALEERCRKHLAALETLEARQDPVKRRILDDAFDRLELDDRTGNIRSAIARYPLDHVVAGIATFEGKRTAGTLPDAVDGRYLLGIVCNISRKDEGLAIAEALLEARIEARDHMLAHLRTERDALLARTGEGWAAALGALLDKAMDAPGTLERLYWLRQAADDIRGRPASRHAALLRFAARRIHASFRVHHEERQAAYRYLAREVLPLK